MEMPGTPLRHERHLLPRALLQGLGPAQQMQAAEAPSFLAIIAYGSVAALLALIVIAMTIFLVDHFRSRVRLPEDECELAETGSLIGRAETQSRARQAPLPRRSRFGPRRERETLVELESREKGKGTAPVERLVDVDGESSTRVAGSRDLLVFDNDREEPFFSVAHPDPPSEMDHLRGLQLASTVRVEDWRTTLMPHATHDLPPSGGLSPATTDTLSLVYERHETTDEREGDSTLGVVHDNNDSTVLQVQASTESDPFEDPSEHDPFEDPPELELPEDISEQPLAPVPRRIAPDGTVAGDEAEEFFDDSDASSVAIEDEVDLTPETTQDWSPPNAPSRTPSPETPYFDTQALPQISVTTSPVPEHVYPDPDVLPLPSFPTSPSPLPSPSPSPALKSTLRMRHDVDRPSWSLRASDAPVLALPPHTPILALPSASVSDSKSDRSSSKPPSPAHDPLLDPRPPTPPPKPKPSPTPSSAVSSAVSSPTASRRKAYRTPVPELDLALAMQLRPGFGAGADGAWMVRFLMAVFGWMGVLMVGGWGSRGRQMAMHLQGGSS